MKGALKFMAVVMAMAFCILFGVSLATQGTERIHGPLGTTASPGGGKPPARSYAAAPAGKQAAAAEAPVKPAGAGKAEPPAPRPEPVKDTGVNRFGNKVGDLLQIVAYHGMRWIVTLFEAIFS
ncbi:hypothetical protein LJK88_19270 [Paenibacillus sp. P26]|nr:hypothetical protein LJK88_19270 [Paenibacillus sp. P26]UUZ96167.1 hypothetical protein LJK87_18555 [Paenibacillus sp. P25]